MVGRNYPFVRFMTLIFIPTMYWISVVELGCLLQSHEEFSLSFGQVGASHFCFWSIRILIGNAFLQVLAMFVALPPLFTTAKLFPRFSIWAKSLAWVRFIRKLLRLGSEDVDGRRSEINSTEDIGHLLNKTEATLNYLPVRNVSPTSIG